MSDDYNEFDDAVEEEVPLRRQTRGIKKEPRDEEEDDYLDEMEEEEEEDFDSFE